MVYLVCLPTFCVRVGRSGKKIKINKFKVGGNMHKKVTSSQATHAVSIMMCGDDAQWRPGSTECHLK